MSRKYVVIVWTPLHISPSLRVWNYTSSIWYFNLTISVEIKIFSENRRKSYSREWRVIRWKILRAVISVVNVIGLTCQEVSSNYVFCFSFLFFVMEQMSREFLLMWCLDSSCREKPPKLKYLKVENSHYIKTIKNSSSYVYRHSKGGDGLGNWENWMFQLFLSIHPFPSIHSHITFTHSFVLSLSCYFSYPHSFSFIFIHSFIHSFQLFLFIHPFSLQLSCHFFLIHSFISSYITMSVVNKVITPTSLYDSRFWIISVLPSKRLINFP